MSSSLDASRWIWDTLCALHDQWQQVSWALFVQLAGLCCCRWLSATLKLIDSSLPELARAALTWPNSSKRIVSSAALSSSPGFSAANWIARCASSARPQSASAPVGKAATPETPATPGRRRQRRRAQSALLASLRAHSSSAGADRRVAALPAARNSPL